MRLSGIFARAILGAAVATFVVGSMARNAGAATSTMTQPRLGAVKVVAPEGDASAFVILLSDPHAQTASNDPLLGALTERGAAVAVIDAGSVRAVLQSVDKDKACIDLFGDLESLARTAERQIGLRTWQQPVLLGVGEAGTIAYLGLAQAPSNTFAGAVSFGFSPSLSSAKSFCDVSPSAGTAAGTFTYEPAKLAGHWTIVTSNPVDPVLRPFLDINPGSKAIAGSLDDAASRDVAVNAVFEIAATTASALGDLPLVELPTKHPKILVIFFSGDGGWRDIDKQLGEMLSNDGVAVIGVDALRYFWSKKDPQTIAADIERIAHHYGPLWGIKSFALAGYSFGAGIIPLVWPKLDPQMQGAIGLIAMLGLEPVARLQMSMAGWLGLSSAADIPLGPYLAQLPQARVMCIFSVEEQTDKSTGCTLPELDGAMRVAREGGHHFGGDYQAIAQIILKRLHSVSAGR